MRRFPLGRAAWVLPPLLISSYGAAQEIRIVTLPDAPACTAEQARTWGDVHDGMLGVTARDPGGDDIRFAPAKKPPFENNWLPITGSKETICGRVDQSLLFSTGDEQDHNVVLVPESPFTGLLDDARAMWALDGGGWASGVAWEAFLELASVQDPGTYMHGREYPETLRGIPAWIDCEGEDDCFEAELTPARSTSLLLPSAPARRCVYGPWVREASHNHRPEIHPAELSWWKGDTDRWWLVTGQDASGRFGERGDYAQPPRTGWRPWAAAPVDGDFRLALELSATAPARMRVSDEITSNVPLPSRSGPPVHDLRHGGRTVLQILEEQEHELDVRVEGVCRVPSSQRLLGYLALRTEVGLGAAPDQAGLHVLRVDREPLNPATLAKRATVEFRRVRVTHGNPGRPVPVSLALSVNGESAVVGSSSMPLTLRSGRWSTLQGPPVLSIAPGFFNVGVHAVALVGDEPATPLPNKAPDPADPDAFFPDPLAGTEGWVASSTHTAPSFGVGTRTLRSTDGALEIVYEVAIEALNSPRPTPVLERPVAPGRVAVRPPVPIRRGAPPERTGGDDARLVTPGVAGAEIQPLDTKVPFHVRTGIPPATLRVEGGRLVADASVVSGGAAIAQTHPVFRGGTVRGQLPDGSEFLQEIPPVVLAPRVVRREPSSLDAPNEAAWSALLRAAGGAPGGAPGREVLRRVERWDVEVIPAFAPLRGDRPALEELHPLSEALSEEVARGSPARLRRLFGSSRPFASEWRYEATDLVTGRAVPVVEGTRRPGAVQVRRSPGEGVGERLSVRFPADDGASVYQLVATTRMRGPEGLDAVLRQAFWSHALVASPTTLRGLGLALAAQGAHLPAVAALDGLAAGPRGGPGPAPTASRRARMAQAYAHQAALDGRIDPPELRRILRLGEMLRYTNR